MPKFIPFIETKYLVHAFGYRISPAIIESPSTSVLEFETFIRVNQRGVLFGSLNQDVRYIGGL